MKSSAGAESKQLHSCVIQMIRDISRNKKNEVKNLRLKIKIRVHLHCSTS